MRIALLLVAWLAIVAAFAAYGYQGYLSNRTPGTFYLRRAVESTVACGALGIGVATCVAAGWVVIRNVRSRRLARGWAVLILAASSMISIVLPLLVLAVATAVPLPEGAGVLPRDESPAERLFVGGTAGGWQSACYLSCQS
jgi:TRAP-type C4-dicarboxylate transport system permease large subunit